MLSQWFAKIPHLKYVINLPSQGESAAPAISWAQLKNAVWCKLYKLNDYRLIALLDWNCHGK